jgi:hypothetical protein
VKLRFLDLSDGKEQYAELLQGEHGLQRNWLVIKPMASVIGTRGAATAGISGMKVAELRDELKQLGLDTAGLKADLARLTEARTAEEGAEQEPQ